VHEHRRAGVLSLDERFKRRAADLYGTPVLIDRTPGCHEAAAVREGRPLRLSKLITDKKPLLLAFHICRSTELMMRLNCMMHPT